MLAIVKFIRYVFKVLSSDTALHEIGLGFVLGMWLGLAPLTALYRLFLILMFLVVRCNLAALILGFLVFKPLALLLFDRVSNALGRFLLLSAGPLSEFIGRLSYLPILSWAELNDTLVVGGMVLGWLLAIPVFLLMVWLVKRYRLVVPENRRDFIRRIVRKYWLFRIAYWVLAGPLDAL